MFAIIVTLLVLDLRPPEVPSVVLSVAWLGLYHHLNRHRDLLWAHVPSRFFAVERGRAVAGITGYALAALVGGLVSVPVALALPRASGRVDGGADTERGAP